MFQEIYVSLDFRLCEPEEFFQGIFDIFIPQTVHHGVQHGEHHGVKCRYHLVPLKGIAGTWTGVDVENGAIVQGDRDQVGGVVEKALRRPWVERIRKMAATMKA